jgi:hypothetical protein
MKENQSIYLGASDVVPRLKARLLLSTAAVALAAHGESIIQDLKAVIAALDLDADAPEVVYSDHIASVEPEVVGVYSSNDRIGMAIRFAARIDEQPRRVERCWLWPSGRLSFVEQGTVVRDD